MTANRDPSCLASLSSSSRLLAPLSQHQSSQLDGGNCTASSPHIHHRSLDDSGPYWIPARYVKPAQVKMHTEDEQDDKKHQDDVASGIDQPHN
ncbi:hypothetical protein GRJ2_003463600 [Grus japonensis]|uniref:Uncharacterized protein n=1 Tax=Grus japonensis TaxID=30415 RepID=A0ABC9YKD4_GRUJA